MIKKWIGSFALWVMGWKIELQGDKQTLNRCVLVVAPHTTNWEFVLGNFSLLEARKTYQTHYQRCTHQSVVRLDRTQIGGHRYQPLSAQSPR